MTWRIKNVYTLRTRIRHPCFPCELFQPAFPSPSPPVVPIQRFVSQALVEKSLPQRLRIRVDATHEGSSLSHAGTLGSYWTHQFAGNPKVTRFTSQYFQKGKSWIPKLDDFSTKTHIFDVSQVGELKVLTSQCSKTFGIIWYRKAGLFYPSFQAKLQKRIIIKPAGNLGPEL